MQGRNSSWARRLDLGLWLIHWEAVSKSLPAPGACALISKAVLVSMKQGTMSILLTVAGPILGTQ